MYIEHITDKNSAQFEEFKNFTANGPKGHILQSYEWGEVKSKTDWQPIRFIVKDDNHNIKAACSILKRKIPGINKNLFYVPRGFVIDYYDDETLDFVLQKIKKLAKEHGAFLLKMDPDIKKNEEIKRVFQRRGFILKGESLNFEGIQPRFVFRLNIKDKNTDEILSDMDRKTRYNIRLSEKKGVTIKSHCNKEDLKIFYDILKVTAKRDKFMIRSYGYFENIWDNLVENGMAKLFMADSEGQYISGILTFIYGDKVWYMYGASDNNNRNKMPNYLLQWEAIKWAKENGCSLYDFRGVSGDLSEDNPLYGLYRFKKGFSGEFVEFIGEIDLPYSRFWYNVFEKGIPVYKNLRRRLIKRKK